LTVLNAKIFLSGTEESKKEEEDNEALQELANKNHWTRCPQCNFFVSKSTGIHREGEGREGEREEEGGREEAGRGREGGREKREKGRNHLTRHPQGNFFVSML
jgi:hypothetical protein